MKTKYSIGIFILVFVLIYLLFSSVYKNNEAIIENENTEKTITTDSKTTPNKGFYLYEVNGYVVVYKNDRKTPYEYTDINFDELPELLKKEIKNGKYISDTDTLYGFLENYSS